MFLKGPKMNLRNLIDPRFKVIRKTADETVNNSVAFQSDNELLFTVQALETWGFELTIYADVKAASDWQGKWTIPAGCGGRWSIPGNANGDWALTDAIQWLAAADRTGVYRLFGIIDNGATAGTVGLTWAQVAAVAENTTVKAGSSIILTRLN